MKNAPIVIGDYSWYEARDGIVRMLVGCQDEKEFSITMGKIMASCGTIKQIRKTRKNLGIKPLTKKEEESIKWKTIK